MQHIEADESLAVERYLLGEMNAKEMDEFEEHLFTCPQCAELVKAGAAFVDNSRSVFKEPLMQPAPESPRQSVAAKPAPWWRGFWAISFAPALAALVLVCLMGYQHFVVIPNLRTQLAELTAPQNLSTFALHAASRGTEQSITVPADARFVSFYFDVAVASASGYSCAIEDATGSRKFTEHLPPPPPEAAGMLHLLVGRSSLPAGTYTLTVSVESPNATEIGRYPFQIQYP